MSHSQYSWSNYTYQVNKYMSSMRHNPYFQELQQDIRMDKLHSFHRLFDKPYGSWIESVLCSHLSLSHSWVDLIYSKFTNDTTIRQFVQHIIRVIPYGNTAEFVRMMQLHLQDIHATTSISDTASSSSLREEVIAEPNQDPSEDTSSIISSLFNVTNTDAVGSSAEDCRSELDSLVSACSVHASSSPLPSTFQPTPLKFVTNTSLSHLNTVIYANELYEAFTAPERILNEPKTEELETPVFESSTVGRIVACKVANRPVKGYFKKENDDNFENCSTIHVVVDETKSINVKLFNNGCMQLTGVRDIQDGKRAAFYTVECIRTLQEQTGRTIVENIESLRTITLETVPYRTVMMNGCYELGFLVNREALHDIMRSRYQIQSIFDSEGYPGVRIPFYYNPTTAGTEHEGRCMCTPMCPSPSMEKARKNKEKSKLLNQKTDKRTTGKPAPTQLGVSSMAPCRRIAVMVFQSGSVIISGGCSLVQDDTIYQPYYSAYQHINRLLEEILPDIRMIGVVRKNKRVIKPKLPGSVATSTKKNQGHGIPDKEHHLTKTATTTSPASTTISTFQTPQPTKTVLHLSTSAVTNPEDYEWLKDLVI